MAFEEGLYEELTALENLRYTASLYPSTPDPEERIIGLLRKTELIDFKNLVVRCFSGGMKQKLSLCAALLHRPSILLLDEPSTGIDPHSRRVFWELLFDLPEEGTTLIITTPYFDEIERCERVALLSEGQVLWSGNPKDFHESAEIRAVDLQTDNILQTVDYLEDHVPHDTYRVRGNTLHVIYHPSQLKPETLKGSLAAEGVTVQQFLPARVEMEDLFYLQLKNLSDPKGIKSNFRMEWIWPKEKTRFPEIIRAEGIQKSYGEVQALKSSSFSIVPGEIFGIIGSNGAGKTTTLKILGGLLKPDQGLVRLLGKDPSDRDDEVQIQLGYMSQQFSLYQDLTILENIQFYGGIYSLKSPLLDKSIEWILNITDLYDHRDRKVRDLPTGWRQRLALGCTLVHDPRVIFLDEPTSGVDPVTRRYFWHWMNFLAHQGRTILVTTHDMSEAEQCHRVMLLHQGDILALGTPESICEREKEDKLLIDLTGIPLKMALARLQGIRGIRSVNPFGSHLHLSFDPSEWSLDKLSSFLGKEKVPFEGMRPISYSIEDVFVERIRSQAH